MPYETKPAAIQAPLPGARQASRGAAGAWHHLPTVAKCVVIVPLSMALLGAEIELHLSPQLDVLLNAAAVWGVWAWLTGNTRHLR